MKLGWYVSCTFHIDLIHICTFVSCACICPSYRTEVSPWGLVMAIMNRRREKGGDDGKVPGMFSISFQAMASAVACRPMLGW